jgi:uncharacterized protein (TIGR02569 family)
VPLPPPLAVVESFGGEGAPSPLTGGRGSAWRVGQLVLRPVDHGEPPLDWQRDVLGSIADDGFRVSLPCTTLGGELESGGWCAWQLVEGAHEEGRWREIIAVGERFHRAISDVPEPAFVAERSDPWAIGDRVAWGELEADRFAGVAHVPDLAAARRMLDAPRQLVHGDLTGNVLFAEGLAPGIIDFSPYWRPPSYASAVVVADALVWEGADESLLDAVAHVPRFPQFLVRALIMRIVVDRLFREAQPTHADDRDPFSNAVGLACRLAASEP